MNKGDPFDYTKIKNPVHQVNTERMKWGKVTATHKTDEEFTPGKCKNTYMSTWRENPKPERAKTGRGSMKTLFLTPRPQKGCCQTPSAPEVCGLLQPLYPKFSTTSSLPGTHMPSSAAPPLRAQETQVPTTAQQTTRQTVCRWNTAAVRVSELIPHTQHERDSGAGELGGKVSG